MTIQETRQLGVEFERRLQTIDPSMIIQNKIDTEDIYSFLNQYQDIYVKQMYLLLTQGEPESVAVRRAYSILRNNIHKVDMQSAGELYKATQQPQNPFWLYVDSYSMCTSSYKSSEQTSPLPIKNILANPLDNLQTLNSPYNKGAIIRNPIVALINSDENQFPTIRVHKDSYTTIPTVVLEYISKPVEFGISMNKSVACSLGSDAFDDLVQGAVQLFVNHKRGLPQQQQQQQQQPRRQEQQEDEQ